MSDLPKDHDEVENDDLFDFPSVEGFSPDFVEAARLQTEAANAPTEPPFEDQEVVEDVDETLEEEDVDDDFVDDFADLMGDTSEELSEEEPSEEAVTSTAQASGPFDFRIVWGALALLFTANLLWTFTWHTSEDRLRGEMDQRFQSYLAQQRVQLTEAVSAMTPSEVATAGAQDERPALGNLAPSDTGTATLEEIKRDLMHSRYETARSKAWRLIARIDAFPVERRASTEASARLLIAESYEIEGTDSQGEGK